MMATTDRTARRHVTAQDIDRIRSIPAYTFVEAAHYLNLPVTTLRAWCLGQHYRYRGDRRRFESLIRLDGRSNEGLSFFNLIEAHVLAAIRRGHGVPMRRVRAALEYVGTKLGMERPLLDVRFQTDGIDLFVEELDRIVNVSREGQLEIASMIRTHLARIERDDRGVPVKLYPFTRKDARAGAPNPVEIDPSIAFGRPVLRGRAVPTAFLADRFKAGDTLRELAEDYGVGPESIEEAIRCELDRREAA
jgi:uncharacterized protein (DUF433 family)